jgi:tight adherence protein B
MFFGENLTGLAFMFMIAIAVGATALALFYPMFASSSISKRVNNIATANSSSKAVQKTSLRQRLMEDPKDQRRKQIADSLKQVEANEKKRKKKPALKAMIAQAGLEASVQKFWLVSVGVGIVFAIVPLILGAPLFAIIGAAFVGFLGFPRWVLGYLRKRRQNKFLNDFADAIDVMVRGLKAGLPVTDAMRIIATESGPPVGPEFVEVVEGQRVGISIDVGVERMCERMPLQEVNFLAIVMAIQSKTGGNLSEALANLSKVLRDRKKMKAKIRAISQEAKSSAAIIGSLPFFIMGALTVLNPAYLSPLFDTKIGNIVVLCSGTWMGIGILVMRQMINFEI